MSNFDLFGTGTKKPSEIKPEDEIAKAVIRVSLIAVSAALIGIVLGVLFLKKRRLQFRVEKDFHLEKQMWPLAVGGITLACLIVSESMLIDTGFKKITLISFLFISALCLGIILRDIVLWALSRLKVASLEQYKIGVSWTLLIVFYLILGIKYWPILNFIVNDRVISGIVAYFSIEVSCFACIVYFRKILAPVIFSDDGRITTDILDVKVKFDSMKNGFSDCNRAPIGISMVTGQVIYLERAKRLEHLIFAGATGTGKSTIMKCLVAHGMMHDFPAIIIDQKGDGGLYDLFLGFAKKFGKDPNRIIKFSLADQEGSIAYNPLRHGSAVEIKDRIMGSFTWSDPYYEALAARVLGMILPCFHAVSAIPTLQSIRDLIIVDDFVATIEKSLETKRAQAEKSGQLELVSYLSGCLDGLSQVQDMKKEDLQGLLAQLDILANIETGKILSPKAKDQQIDFDLIIEKKQIVIFELPAANGDQSRRIGRMILGHLKSYMALIESKRKPCPDFLPVYIDEFGAYADVNFCDFLKQARSAGMAIHCFFQSRGDLTQVSDSFETQMMDNTVYKGILRQDSPDSAEHWSKTAGTQDAVERSYQVGNFLGTGVRTGMGNERLTKQMIVEHDVFKRLRKFQMVLIEKDPNKIDVISLWTGPLRNFQI